MRKQHTFVDKSKMGSGLYALKRHFRGVTVKKLLSLGTDYI